MDVANTDYEVWGRAISSPTVVRDKHPAEVDFDVLLKPIECMW